MKKVLLLGDSIRMRYQPFVKDLMEGTAEVVGPAENCAFAKFTLWHVDSWIATLGPADVIHWNNGIWDLYHHTDEHGIFTPMDEYVATVKRVLARLRKAGVPIIWATTTAVTQECVKCNNEEIDAYNEAVLKVMRAENIAVNDLNAVIKQNRSEFISEDNLHLSIKGNKACAAAVVKAVKSLL